MRIAFLDPSPLDYTVETPYHQPLGGTQSAVSYLSVELAKLGHAVFLINNTTQRGVYQDVMCLSLSEGGRGGFLNTCDVVIVVTAVIGKLLREIERVTTRILLWIHIPHDQPAMLGLLSDAERDHWDGYIFVSKWQRDSYRRFMSIPLEKSFVRGNAIAPSIAAQPLEAPWFMTGKAPVLVYPTTPFRGLVSLLDAFPTIRAAVPDVRLKVLSSMNVYHKMYDDGAFAELYERCRTTEGVEYSTSVGQQQLAVELAGAAVLAYPCTFPESSCIVAMEALALGATVVATDAGALPETTAGFGKLVPWTGDPAELVPVYAQRVIETLLEARDNPEGASAWRVAQVSFAHRFYNWPARAREWNDWPRGPG